LPRRLTGFGVAAGLALALAASFPSHASAASATGCSVQKRAARIVSLKRFKRQVRPARAAFFRKHKSARVRHAFRAGQQRRLTALKRAVKKCGSAGAIAAPEAAPDPVPPPCSPSLYSAPFTEMNEGTTNTALPLRPSGPIRAVMLFAYAMSGLLAGLGGVIMASQLKSGAPTYGLMYELFVIAAAVVGGTSLSGGYGKVLGTLIGAFIIAVIQNGMNLTGVESYTQKVVLGLVILGAVLVDTLKKRGWEKYLRRSKL